MAVRKWLVRSLFLAFIAALGSGALFVYAWMRPEFIRSELTRQLGERFYDADIEVDGARLRVLGGISVTNLRIIRHDDPSRTPVVQVPSAVLHYDKEQLNDGHLVIQKIDMFKPRLRIERNADGKWNVDELVKPPRDNEPLPIFILHEATIAFYDRRHGEKPLAEMKNVDATIVNDPSPIITMEARGNGQPGGPFTLNASFDKRVGFSGSLDLSNLAIGKELTNLLECWAPEVGETAKPLSGQAAAHFDFAWRQVPAAAFYYDLLVQLHGGRYDFPNFPYAMDHIEAAVRCKNGDITVDKATARVGQGVITVSMDLPREPPTAPHSVPLDMPTVSTPLSPGPSPAMDFLERLRSLDTRVANLRVTPDFFERLPGKASIVGEMFAPSGVLSGDYSFRRQEGHWQKRLVIEPQGMEALYRGFPYRMRNVRGQVVHTAGDTMKDHIQLNLQCEAAGTTVSVNGTVKGGHANADVDVRIEGRGATLDDEMIAAMPDDNPAVLRRLHATAFGDFVGLIRHNERIRREYGPDVFDNLFTINIKKGTMKYEEFPFLLDSLTGELIVRTVPERPTRLPAPAGQPVAAAEKSDVTTLEFHHFEATHQGAKIRGTGRKDPAPGGGILLLNIDAESLPLDNDLRTALAAIRLDNCWQTFEPSGQVNCSTRVKLYTKADPAAVLNPAEDLEMSLQFAGGAVKPAFFPYLLHDLSGLVVYGKNRAALRDMHARHGDSQITLPYSEVIFRPSGGYWADLHDLKVDPLKIDQSFLEALSPGLRSAAEGLQLRGPIALDLRQMVIDEQPGPFLPRSLPAEVNNTAISAIPTSAPAVFKTTLPTIYWDGNIVLAGASLKTGVDWEDVHGVLASWGLFKEDRLHSVRGNVAFESARIAKQPVEAITASLRVDPRQPDLLTIPAIRAKLFGGDVGGEASILLDPAPRYSLQLNAARIMLSKIAKEYKLPQKAHLEGLASAQIYLANRADERTGQLTLEGAGSIDVPNGRILNLPVLLNLIKVVRLRVPDDTGFEEAHALFTLRGDRMKFSQLDLIGNAISLGGSGEMKTDGTEAQFEFYPVWTKMKEMFSFSGDWTAALSKKFLKIKATGDLNGKLDYSAEPVPGIVDPVKRIRDLLSASR